MTTQDSGIGLIRHEDMVQPFVLHKSSVRGRMVRMCPTIDRILSRHNNPPEVNRMLGELLTLAAMLSANLPEDGILTMQAKGDGPVSFLVVDAVHGGGLRGYANLQENAETTIADMAKHSPSLSLTDLMGTGYLAITLNMGRGIEPYQGIVPLEGDNFTHAVQHYFTQSQQIDVLFNLHVAQRVREDGSSRWAAGGIMLERMPEEGGIKQEQKDEIKGWEYNALLVDTATEDELLDPHLAPSALLYRLFNEGGVWVNDACGVSANCRCSREKVSNMLCSLGAESLEELKEDGVITVTCQFCNTDERFTEDDIKKLMN